MKIDYRGFDIEVNRKAAMGGWTSCYYTVIRQSDGWMWQDSFQDSDISIGEMIIELKNDVDEFWKDPKAYEEAV